MAVAAEDSGNTHTTDAHMEIIQDPAHAPEATNRVNVISSKSARQNPIQQKVENSNPTRSVPNLNANQEPEISATPPISTPGHPSKIPPEQPLPSSSKMEDIHMDINLDSSFLYWSANRETERWWDVDSDFIADTDDPSYDMHWDVYQPSKLKKVALPRVKRRRLRAYHLHLRRKFCLEMYGELIESSEDEQPHRPSDIVKGLDEDSDIDFPKEERKFSRRRRCATALKLSLMRRNMVHPCSQFELERYGLKNYGEQLRVPAKDRDIHKHKPYYRNLFRQQYPGRRRSYLRTNENRDGSDSQATCGGNYTDRDYFEPSDRKADVHAEVRKSFPLISKQYLGKGIVEDKDISREKRVTIMSAGKLFRCPDIYAKAKKPPYVLNPHFNMLLSTMATDPSALFADLDDNKKETKIENQIKNAENDGDDAKEDKEDSFDEWWSSDDEQTIPVFEWMKRDISKKFYTVHKSSKSKSKKNKKKKHRAPQSLEHAIVRETPQAKGLQVSGMNFSSTFSMKYLAKHNFQGRLGRNAQGAPDIVAPMNVSSGGGIGSRRLQEQNNDMSLAAQIARVKPVNFSELKAATQRQRPNPKKRARSPVRKASDKSQKLEEDDGIIYLDVEPATVLPDDNKRRAVLLDLDSCFVNSHSRRLKAFRMFIERCPEFPNAEAVLFSPHGDLSDRCVVKALMKKHGMETGEEDIEKLLCILDAAFKSSGPLELDTIFAGKIRDWSNFANIGVLHLGTSSRMNDELKLSGLERIVARSGRIAVQSNDIVPYIGSWRELLVRVGMPASQSVFFIPDRQLNLRSNGVIAARALGSRSFVKVDTRTVMSKSEDGKHGPYIGAPNLFGADCAMYTKLLVHTKLSLAVFLKKQKRRKQKHVLARRPSDELLHSAVEFFRASSLPDIFVRFDSDGELSWVPVHEVYPLERDGFLKLKENDFAGVFEPGDVHNLQLAKKSRRV